MAQADLILIKLLKEGNVKVFEAFYDKYFDPILVYCNHYVTDREMAKEMAQDTFLKLWETKESLNNNTNIQSFLYRIARNNCLNHIKHLKVEQKYLDYTKAQKTEIELNELALSQSSAEKIISEELEEKINLTIGSLPPRCRQVFELSRFKGKKYREIASDLNISVKTVENQIQKALKILRENIFSISLALLLHFLIFF